MYGDMGGMAPPQGMDFGGMDMGGMAPPMPPEPAPQGGPISDLLSQMLVLARQYKDQEQSQQNILSIEQVTTLIQKILAAEEKEADDLLQGKMSPSAVRSAVSGPQY